MASNIATGVLSRTRGSPAGAWWHVLYLGEINDTQELAWRRSIEVLEEGTPQPRALSLFPEDRCRRQAVFPLQSDVADNFCTIRRRSLGARGLVGAARSSPQPPLAVARRARLYAAAAEPMVCRLYAGGDWLRTSSSAMPPPTARAPSFGDERRPLIRRNSSIGLPRPTTALAGRLGTGCGLVAGTECSYSP